MTEHDTYFGFFDFVACLWALLHYKLDDRSQVICLKNFDGVDDLVLVIRGHVFFLYLQLELALIFLIPPARSGWFKGCDWFRDLMRLWL
jgi:hypothetical protein